MSRKATLSGRKQRPRNRSFSVDIFAHCGNTAKLIKEVRNVPSIKTQRNCRCEFLWCMTRQRRIEHVESQEVVPREQAHGRHSASNRKDDCMVSQRLTDEALSQVWNDRNTFVHTHTTPIIPRHKLLTSAEQTRLPLCEHGYDGET